MQLITNGRTVNYSVTPGGNYIETIKTRNGQIMHTYPDVQSFLNRFMRATVASEAAKIKEEDRLLKLSSMSNWWEAGSFETITDAQGNLKKRMWMSGNFNMELYNKIREAKSTLKK